MNFRSAILEDLPEMKQLYVDTIRMVCRKDYTEEQVAVWSSSANQAERWLDMMVNQFVLIAESDGVIAGFGSLKNNNYIDFFYVHACFQGQGVAGDLLRLLQKEAVNHGEKLLSSDISMTAKPFFEKQGFKVVVGQENVRGDVILINYKMIKHLPGPTIHPELKAVFNIQDTFNITGRGLVITGLVVDGEIFPGDTIEFIAENELRRRKVRGLDMIRLMERTSLLRGLLIQCKDKEEIDELRAWRPFNVIAGVYGSGTNLV
jgi:putative acetyltransferase